MYVCVNIRLKLIYKVKEQQTKMSFPWTALANQFVVHFYGICSSFLCYFFHFYVIFHIKHCVQHGIHGQMLFKNKRTYTVYAHHHTKLLTSMG